MRPEDTGGLRGARGLRGSRACAPVEEGCTLFGTRPSIDLDAAKERALAPRNGYSAEQGERLNKIHARLIEARRELDALIGDAYLRPRASIVPVHFLDLASAAEKLRWAEKEWRELDKELSDARARDAEATEESGDEDEEDADDLDSEPLAELARADVR